MAGRRIISRLSNVAFFVFLLLPGCGYDWAGIRTPTRLDDSDSSGNSSGLPDDNSIEPDGSSVPVCVSLGRASDVNRREMLNLLNQYRAQNNLGTLDYSLTLQRAADDYAERMASEGFFDHTAPDGSTAGVRVLDAGFCNEYVGENLAWGRNQVSTAAEAMQGFKDSPGHNENMLRSGWEYVGVGFYQMPTSAGMEYWWVQLFGNE